VIELGPLNASIHKINEHVGLDELEILSDVYEQILINLLA
jgi:succinyl-diaminopimelate desuccinylase